MTRAVTDLRRMLLGLAFLGALAFGSVQAFATPKAATPFILTCPNLGYDYYYSGCRAACISSGPPNQPICSYGYCTCGIIND